MTRDNWSPEVARALHEYHDAAPLPPSIESLEGHPLPPPRRSTAVTVAAVVLVVAAVVGLVAVLRRHDTTPVGPATIEVHHHQYRTTIEGKLECDTPITGATPFTSVLIDMWADRSGRQWHHRITYPDGSTFDVVMRGSIVYPTALFDRGTNVTSDIGCNGPNGESMSLVRIADPGDAITLKPELAPDELPYVQLFDQQGTLIDTNATDSQGRATHRWEKRLTGSAGYGHTADLPVLQTTTWWVDARDGTTVTQREFTNQIDTLGTATQTDELLVDEVVQASPDLFSTDGYTQRETFPRPPSPNEPTTTVKGGTPVTTGNSAVTTNPSDTSIAPPFTTDPSGNCVGDDVDLSKEPPLWRQPNNADWFHNGCLVRIDVITDRPGPDHCGWGTARVIVTGPTIGVPFTSPADDVEYVRDPANVFGMGLNAGYLADTTLPPEAVDTGYRTATEALWTVPGDDRYLYLVLDGRTERWPKGDTPVCS